MQQAGQSVAPDAKSKLDLGDKALAAKHHKQAYIYYQQAYQGLVR